MVHDYIVIGGGVVGLSTAMQLSQEQPGERILLLEKEDAPAQHQSGRNSGVIHSGIYYRPGSFKARFARAGAESMVRFCRENEIPHSVCGKLIVATASEELPRLEALYQRGLANGVPVERLTAEQAREIEPHVNAMAAVRVRSTGITDFRAVAKAYLRHFRQNGGEARFGCRARSIREVNGFQVVETTEGAFEAKFVINCAGLHSDRLARTNGLVPPGRIVPFRGEYYELVPEKRSLVRSLIYPVPDPAFPFLGVHFTRMIDGSVHAGPNAVLALAREGYRRSDCSPRDLAETLTFPGFWRLLARHREAALDEWRRSCSKRLFTASLARLIPEITADDLRPCPAGVRAQALTADGALVDDFLLVPGRNALHVCNAPSPAATASLEIGAEIIRLLPRFRHAAVAVTDSISTSRIA